MESGVGPDGRRRVLKVARNDVAEMKEALISALLSPLAVGKIKQRQVIQMLLPEIKALRSSGVEFEEIAAVLRTKGMRLSGETLRMYYFDEKREADDAVIKKQVADHLAMADRVMSHMTDVAGKGAQAVLNRVLQEASAVAPKAKRLAAPPAVDPTTATPPQGGNAVGSEPPAPAGDDNGGQDGPRQRTDGGAGDEKQDGHMSLHDVERMLAQEVDLSAIPRRPRPTD